MTFGECRSFIAFGFDVTMGRIYFMNGEFIVMTVDNATVNPFGSKNMSKVADYVFELCSSASSEVDYNIHYNKFGTSKKKKNQLFKLIEDKTLSRQFIVKSLLYV